jgi:hypothetical protein
VVFKNKEEFVFAWRDRVPFFGQTAQWGDSVGRAFKEMPERFVMSEAERRKGFTPIEGVAKLFGKEEKATAMKEKIWDTLEPVKRAGVKGVSVVGDVFIADTIKNPSTTALTWVSGVGVGKVVRYVKPAVSGVFKPVVSTLAKTPIVGKAGVKGLELGFKVGGIATVGGLVGYDLIKSEDPARRTAEMTKFALLFGAGYGIGRGNLATQPYEGKSLSGMGKKGGVRTGKSPRSKASIRRQSRGLPQKGKKIRIILRIQRKNI